METRLHDKKRDIGRASGDKKAFGKYLDPEENS